MIMRPDKKRDRAVEVADPNLGGASVEIESAFFVDLGRGVGRGHDLDANIRRTGEEEGIDENFRPMRSEPGDIDGLYAASGRNRTFRNGKTLRKQIGEERGDGRLAAPMTKSWRGTHEDVAILIGLDAIGELPKFRVSQDLSPTGQVERGLRLKVRKLDSDRHRTNIRQK